MKSSIAKLKKSLATMLLAALLISLFASCNSSQKIEIQDDMALPFDGDGNWAGDSSELSNAYIRYVLESTPDYVISSDLIVKENADTFVDLMSGFEKELVFADMDETYVNEADVPFEDELGTFRYYMTMMISDRPYLLSIFVAEDGGNLDFRTHTNIQYDNYHSIYKINSDDMKSLEDFFGGLITIQTDMTSVEKEDGEYPAPEKPVIYLYPKAEQDVSVKLDFAGELLVTYPEYSAGWNVHAYPDGTLINYADGLEYSYLYWEGLADKQDLWDTSEGYCVSGADTAAFLQKTLSELGLTPKEYNEFIVYWLPQMQDSPYNLISFQWEEYEAIAPLEISPSPDSLLRVFMVFEQLEEPVDIKAPEARLEFARNGFTVVEWGGSKIK